MVNLLTLLSSSVLIASVSAGWADVYLWRKGGESWFTDVEIQTSDGLMDDVRTDFLRKNFQVFGKNDLWSVTASSYTMDGPATQCFDMQLVVSGHNIKKNICVRWNENTKVHYTW